MEESILLTIKKLLGLGNEYTPFDADIIVLINSAIMSLTQLHVGPSKGFSISGVDQRWDEFLTNDVLLEGAKQYIFMKVKMAFDPPTSSFVMDALKQQCSELEWRLNVQAESVERFDFVENGKPPKPKKPDDDSEQSSYSFEFEGEEMTIIDNNPDKEKPKPIIHTAGTVPQKPVMPPPDPFMDKPAKDPSEEGDELSPAYEVDGETLVLFGGIGSVFG